MNFSGGEKLTRFIFSRRHFATEKKIVKYAAFVPPPNSEDLSVFRISTPSEREVWGIGRENVQGERTLRARADLLAEVVYENHLTVIPDTTPHELHANITPFPIDKIARDRIARNLALASQLVIMPAE